MDNITLSIYNRLWSLVFCRNKMGGGDSFKGSSDEEVKKHTTGNVNKQI